MRQPLRFIDQQLNGITMYRLVLYGLMIIAGASLVLSVFGVLGFTSLSLLVLLGLLLIVCFPLNLMFGRLYKVPLAVEPTLISVFILYMILPPVSSWRDVAATIVAGIVTIASKYVLTARGRHIFNPAALGLAVTVVAGLTSSMWWVGSMYMLPFTVAVGLLVVRKTRRFAAVSTFVLTALAVAVLVGLAHSRGVLPVLRLAVVSGPVIFAGTIMLTEPATMPARHKQRLIYAALVGMVYSSHLSAGPISATPEVALLVGNLYALAVTPANRMVLRLVRKRQLSAQVYDLEFESLGGKPPFKAGQYAELTLPLARQDNRGSRRTFTIASAPSENHIHFGVKFYQPSSSFKRALADLQPGAIVHANHINGDFVLLRDAGRKLAFIAGGIGITPFRSQLAELLASHQQRDIVLVYAAATAEEISYRSVLDRAAKRLGLRLVTVAGGGSGGRLAAGLLKRELPDYAERLFYVSGPNRMVDSTVHTLVQMGVRRHNIRTDHFSGY